MLTFSYRDNVKDHTKLEKDWKEFVRLFRVRYPKWQYISVLEKHDSEETSEDKRGSYHMHVAVMGRQDIKWLLRCWLTAIGQSEQDINDWFSRGVKLGDKSLSAVNVRSPKKRWGSVQKKWTKAKLSGYLSKYIGKAFDSTTKYAKKYWRSHNIEKHLIERHWLKAKTYIEAIREAHDIVYYSGATSLSMWGEQSAGVIWITGETERALIGKTVQCNPDVDIY